MIGNLPLGVTRTITKYGGIKHELNGKLHREDGPAIEYCDARFWYINGKIHRTDGPAAELSNGDKHWYINGKLHRIDGPAVENSDGSKEWYVKYEQITIENYQNFIDDYPDLVNQFLAYSVLVR